VRQNIEADQLALSLLKQTNHPLYLNQSFREISPPSQGLLRNWDKIANTSAKNYAYALQWFMIAVVLAGLTFWFQWRRPNERRPNEL
jgi:cytochrome oxidase assembly protein ShyY1